MIVLLEICLNLPNTSELLYNNQIIITVLNRRLYANLQPLTRLKTYIGCLSYCAASESNPSLSRTPTAMRRVVLIETLLLLQNQMSNE